MDSHVAVYLYVVVLRIESVGEARSWGRMETLYFMCFIYYYVRLVSIHS